MTISSKSLVEKAREGFTSRKTRPIAYRKKQLEKLRQLFLECRDEILAALHQDLRKSRHEAMLYEVEITIREINHVLMNLESWAQPDKLVLNLLAILDSGFILSEPYGVVLILGPWNYPILLTVGPMIGAIAAGNTVILKPSEVSSASAALLAKLIPQYLDPECYFVVEGDVSVTKELLIHKFDYIFFTGSTAVGKAVLAAAAPHLTPVTLELGGKSPCYIHESSNFRLAAKRILWAKFINLGQTCIAPDYILCSKEAEAEFLTVAREVIKEWYSETIQSNPDLPRIINQQHFQRLESSLKGSKGRIAFGGSMDGKDLWIEPTIVTDVTADDTLMQEEIFGPILPIMTVNSAKEAIELILSKPKPLAFYIFSMDEPITSKLLADVSSGSVCVNDCVWQSGWDGLPFGGVGESGMGAYHGKYSFDTFSHRKAVLHRSFSYLSEKLGEARYPPYSQKKLDIFKFVATNFHHYNINSPRVLGFFAGLVIFIGVLCGIFLV